MTVMRLKLLGGFELREPTGAIVRLPTRKAEALLAYLAIESRQAHPREALAALLWGEASERGGLASLRQTLSLIGKCTQGQAIVAEGRRVALAPGAFHIDAAALGTLGDAPGAEALEQAAALYQGELLAGLSLNAPRFDDWLHAERERLRERAIDVLARLAAQQRERGDIERAVQSSLKLLEVDPMAERGHRSLMQLYAQGGRRGAALRQYQVCVNVLQRELGAEPEPQTRQLYNALLRQQAPDGADPQSARPAGPATQTVQRGWPTELPVHEAPLTGREAELALLVDALDGLRAQRGRTIALLGEAGLGKTRLTEELAMRAAARGVRVLLGRCHESQQLFPFAPWVELLRGSGLAADRALLDSLDPAWRAELVGLLPELGARPDNADDDRTALAQQARLFEAIVQLLSRLTARSPFLLLLEDLHWADEMSLRLLAQVARRALDWPLLIVATAREEDLSAAPQLRRTLRELSMGQGLSRIELHPLSRQETAAMVNALRRADTHAQLGTQVAERVWLTSEGNPFVVVEATHAIVADPAHQGSVGLSLPDRVREMIRGHIERLSPPARKLVALMAVAGRELDFAVLQLAAAQDAQTASEALEELVRRRVLRLVGESFDFKHARIRQTVTEELLAPTLGALHLSIAQALEQQHAADLGPVGDRLAYHYARTDRHDKAVTYLTRLALRAAHEGAHDEAVATLDQALHHVASGRMAQREQLRRELVFRKARSLFFLGRFGEVLGLLQPEKAKVDAAADPRMAAAYYLRLGSTHTYLGDHASAVRNAERALHEASTCADVATMGKAHFLLSLEHFWAQPALGVQHGQQAAALLEGSREHWWLGQACWILGLNLSYRGRFAEGLAMEARARAMAESTGDRRLASYAAWTTGFIHSLAGDLDLAVPACRHSVQLALDPLNRMTAQGMLALALVEHGDGAEARAVLDEAIPKALQFRIPQMHGLFLAFRGEAALLVGDLAGARDFAAQGADITRQAGYVYGLGWAQRVQARIALASGDQAGAEAKLWEAIATFDGMGAPFEAARTRLELGEWLERAMRHREARACAGAALTDLAALKLERHADRARALLARLDPHASAGAMPRDDADRLT